MVLKAILRASPYYSSVITSTLNIIKTSSSLGDCIVRSWMGSFSLISSITVPGTASKAAGPEIKASCHICQFSLCFSLPSIASVSLILSLFLSLCAYPFYVLMWMPQIMWLLQNMYALLGCLTTNRHTRTLTRLLTRGLSSYKSEWFHSQYWRRTSWLAWALCIPFAFPKYPRIS